MGKLTKMKGILRDQNLILSIIGWDDVINCDLKRSKCVLDLWSGVDHKLLQLFLDCLMARDCWKLSLGVSMGLDLKHFQALFVLGLSDQCLPVNVSAIQLQKLNILWAFSVSGSVGENDGLERIDFSNLHHDLFSLVSLIFL